MRLLLRFSLFLFTFLTFTTWCLGQELKYTIDLIKAQKEAKQFYEKTKNFEYSAYDVLDDKNEVKNVVENIEVPKGKTIKILSHKAFFSSEVMDFNVQNNTTKKNLDLNYLIRNYKGRETDYCEIIFTPGKWISQNRYQLIDSIEFTYLLESNISLRTQPPIFKTESVLKSFTTYKINVINEGVYKITTSDLKKLGIIISSINPKLIKLFTSQSEPKSEKNSAFRMDDLDEISIEIKGESDGIWNDEDEIIFYSQGPHKWVKNSDSNILRITNPYNFNHYLFLQLSDSPGKRIQTESFNFDFDLETDKYDHVAHFEKEVKNILKDEGREGGGIIWFDSPLTQSNVDKNLTDSFNINDLVLNDPATVILSFAARSDAASQLNINIDGTTYKANFNALDLSNFHIQLARFFTYKYNFTQQNSKFQMHFNYPSVGSLSKGYINYVTLNAKRYLIKSKGSLYINYLAPKSSEIIRYNISGISSIGKIWNITDAFNVSNKTLIDNQNKKSFSSAYSNGRYFVAFEPSDILPIQTIGIIENQNIHGLPAPELLIIYPKEFKTAVQEYANYKKSKHNLDVLTLDIDAVQNEFSCGGVDPTGIKDLARMFYFKDPNKFKFLLLVGEGSYDYRSIYNKFDNNNFIPVYETHRTGADIDPLRTAFSDDYFGLLEDDASELIGKMQISVGRFPVRSESQLNTIITKIKRYENPKSGFGNWRKNLLLIADDHDNGGDNFQVQSEELASKIEDIDPDIKIEKVFADVYNQEVNASGQIYPDANHAINSKIDKGVLVVNYIGHGGTESLAQERLIERSQVFEWDNENVMPLFITGSCGFSQFDDPTITSVGKTCFTRPNGGMIAMLTTIRSIYNDNNQSIIYRVAENIFKKINHEHLKIGDFVRNTKNSFPNMDDMKKFVLLGDPSMSLAFPSDTVILETMNGKTLDQPNLDTIQALKKVTLTGSIQNYNNEVNTQFQGEVTVTIYDKPTTLSTKGNDGNLPNYKIKVQNNILFNGKAQVINGKFSISFVPPIDMDYAVNAGKISMYAKNENRDATGSNNKILVGGDAKNPIKDDHPPIIQLYMNDESFKSGSTISSEPLLIAKIKDDYGINISGRSIGHNIDMTLNDNANTQKSLNDYFIADKDSFNNGTIIFPIAKLEPGSYRLKLSAWDIANNRAENEINFVVAQSQDQAIDKVLNYPNPFSTHTNFLFEYNSNNSPIEAQISIYTISGKLVKTLQETISPIGNRFTSQKWNGLDEANNVLGNGVYIYNIKILADNALLNKTIRSEFQKLVILH